MPVDLNKVQREAPHMVNLVKSAGVVLAKKGLDPSKYKAAVLGTTDHSGSTEYGANRLYSDGTMQQITDMAYAAGLQLDDDGSVPWSLFDNRVIPLGDITLSNCRGFMDQHQRYDYGSTSYVAALKWIIQEAGFGHVDLSTGGGRGLLRRSSSGGQLTVKATAPYPTYAAFVTDGEPDRGTEQQIIDLLTLMSQLPIFVQFIGAGSHQFKFLRELDEMDGRLVDNANFFDSKEARDENHMLELMLGEFPDYYAAARRAGLIQ